MEIHDVVTTAITGGTVTGSGGLLYWFVRRQINKILEAVEDIPKDLKGISMKIDSIRDEIEVKINEINVELARLDERIKFTDKK